MLPHPELLSEKRRAKMEQMVRNLHGKLKEIQGNKNDETISSTKKVSRDMNNRQRLLLFLSLIIFSFSHFTLFNTSKLKKTNTM